MSKSQYEVDVANGVAIDVANDLVFWQKNHQEI